MELNQYQTVAQYRDMDGRYTTKSGVMRAYDPDLAFLVSIPGPAPGIEAESGIHTSQLSAIVIRKLALPQLAVAANPDQSRIIPIRKDEAIKNPFTDMFNIGRAQNCDLVLTNPAISKKHGYIHLVKNPKVYIDSNSTHGTRIQDRSVESYTPCELEDGAKIDLAGVVRLTYWSSQESLDAFLKLSE